MKISRDEKGFVGVSEKKTTNKIREANKERMFVTEINLLLT